MNAARTLRPLPLLRLLERAAARVERVAPLLVALLMLLTSPLMAQGLDRPIDEAIRQLRAQQAQNGAFADQSVETVGRYLVAIARSHRAYTIEDGPIARLGRDYLFSCRAEGGAFKGSGDKDAVAATRWAVEALIELHPDKPAEVDAGIQFLDRNGAHGPFAGRPFAERVSALLNDMARSGDAKAWLAAHKKEAVAAAAAGRTPAAAVAALSELVALQVAEKQAASAKAAPEAAPAWAPHQQKAVDFLLGRQKDGWFFADTPAGPIKNLGITALAVTALQTKPAALRTPAEKDAIDKSIQLLVNAQNADGSFGEDYTNYTTCTAVGALAAADRDKYAPLLKKAQGYILVRQHIEALGYHRSDRDYGSFGYGGSERGDLSNSHMAMEALHDTGLAKDHEAWQKALSFLSRTQNLRSTNDFSSAVKDGAKGDWTKVAPGDDGGAAYYPGNSAAGYDKLPDGTLLPRSYGSMTYALLKGYVLCGLPQDDARVVAARQWLERNFSLDENPGASPDMGEKGKYQGLFYYYMAMARTLSLMGVKTVKDGKGADVEWKKALTAALVKLQEPDGSWVNKRNERWWEGGPVLCTAYALIALR